MNYLLHYLHIHKKNRRTEGEAAELHGDVRVKMIDNLIFVIAIFGPLANISQIIKIFSERSSEGLSGLSWTFYALFNLVWIIYGSIHKEKPILISSALWLVTQVIVLIGIAIY